MFYDQKGLASAARGWWLMGLFGHDAAAVLDGGLPKWLKEGRATQDGEPAAPAPATFRPDYRASRLRGVGDILRNVLTGAELVVDARAAGRFTAAVPEPRAGHAQRPHPGFGQPALHRSAARRRHLPAGRGGRGRSRPPASMATRPLVTSCGSGVTACILTLGMRLAGFPEGAVYDGSWTEWGGRSDTPVEVG